MTFNDVLTRVAGRRPDHRDRYTVALGSDVYALMQADADGLIAETDVPAQLAGRRVVFNFAAGQYSKNWYHGELSLAALSILTSVVATKSPKDARGIVLSEYPSDARKKATVVRVNGMMLDADGYPTRDLVKPERLVIAYATASDGKCKETLSLGAYEAGAIKHGLPRVPTPESVVALKGAEKAGSERAYIDTHITIEGDDIVMSFRPQQRTRYVIVFERPLEGDLLRALIDAPGGFKKFGAAMEREVLGVDGTDVTCFEPVRIGYLPTTMESEAPAEHYHQVLGPPVLFDPVPLAERIVAANPPKVRKVHQAEIRADDPIPDHMRDSLEGVLLATLISEYPELVRSENNCEPLVLNRCPFADYHASKTGEADGSAYVYDATETQRYPVMRCHHASCNGRLTEEFVAAMIEDGDITRADVYEEPNNRLRYTDKATDERYADAIRRLEERFL